MRGTIHELVLDAAAGWHAAPFQRAVGAGGRTAERIVVRYSEFAARVRSLARGLVAAGLQPGDRVGIVSENRPEWLLVDLAILAAGGIDVPRGRVSPPAEVEALLGHSGCRFVFVEDAACHAAYVGALTSIERVFVLCGEAPDGTEPLSALDHDDSVPLPEVDPGAVATIVYTSGTTGDPKGVTLTHANIVANVRGLAPVLHVVPGDRFLALLPTWHMYERTLEYFCAWRGGELSYTDLRHFRADLVAEEPEFLASVPRVWESLHDGVQTALRSRPVWVRGLARAALAGSRAYRAGQRALRRHSLDAADGVRSAGATARAWLRLWAWPLHWLAGLLVYGRLHAGTGGHLRVVISGGGALPDHVDAFLDAAGFVVLVGYGLTETSPVIAVRRPRRNVLGTIGTPLEFTELELVEPVDGRGDDGRSDGEREARPAESDVRSVAKAGATLAGPSAVGELRVRGPQVMRGYWDNPAATARVLSPDGWLRTGDLCRFTEAGDIVFVGRAKDTIVLRGGENVEPEPLEQAALADPLISQIVVVGQDRKTLGALVWPCPELVKERWGQAPDPEAVSAAVAVALRNRLGEAAGFRSWECVRRVALLPEALAVETGTLTATMKVRRAVVVERYAALLEQLFHADT